MALKPSAMRSVSFERSRLKERAAQPQTPASAKKRYDRKPCPIQPCDASIPLKWLTCQYHWSLVPAHLRADNRRSAKGGTSHFGHLATCVAALAALWSELEAAAVTTPMELPGGCGHVGHFTCTCPWCSSIYASVRRALQIDDQIWELLLKHLGLERNPT